MAAVGVSGSHQTADAADVEMNGEKAVSGSESAKMKVKQDTMLKEMLRQCAEDAASKTLAELVGKEKADLLVDQMKRLWPTSMTRRPMR